MKKLVCLLIFLFTITSIFSQDSITRKNILAFIPTNLLGRTISVSYNRIIKQGFEISIKSSIRIAKKTEPYENNNAIGDPGLDYNYVFKDPSWYYNRFTPQIGIIHHSDILFIEPTLYYQYGYFNDRTLMTHNDIGEAEDKYCRLDRKYHAMGCAAYAGFIYDEKRLRVKLFFGLAYNYRFYHEKIYEEWSEANPPTAGNFFNTEIQESDYTLNRFGVKFGLELGYIF